MSPSTMDREGAFQELLGLAQHSYLSYVVESSAPVVVDDADRKLLSLFRELVEKERYYVERGYELVERAGFRPMPPTFAIKDTNFNFLRPVKLAEHAGEQIGSEVKALGALKGRLRAGDPAAQEFDRLVDDFLALRREELRRIEENRPPPPPPPPAPAKPAAPGAAAAKPAAPATPAPPTAPAPPGAPKA
jgi:hypothetical protein